MDNIVSKKFIYILFYFRIKDKILKAFESCLKTDKHQISKHNGIYSDSEKVQSGVPRGTIIGPIHYL